MKIDDLPNPDQYWNAPAMRERGDGDELLTFAAVGMTLTTWEQLENRFAGLYAIVVGGSLAAERSYGAIMSNSGRREALKAAGEVFFELRGAGLPNEARKQFTRLLQHLERASSRRDEIAHGVVQHLFLEPADDERPNDLGAFLMPPEYNAKMTRAAISARPGVIPKYRYTSEDMHAIRERFAKLSEAVPEYVHAL